jgi:hypothetical protein
MSNTNPTEKNRVEHIFSGAVMVHILNIAKIKQLPTVCFFLLFIILYSCIPDIYITLYMLIRKV